MEEQLHWSELLKRKMMRLTELELMIESGSSEYERPYRQLEKEIEAIPVQQINEASYLLSVMFQKRKDKMSEIEKEVYERSIIRLKLMQNRDSLRTKNLL